MRFKALATLAGLALAAAASAAPPDLGQVDVIVDQIAAGAPARMDALAARLAVLEQRLANLQSGQAQHQAALDAVQAQQAIAIQSILEARDAAQAALADATQSIQSARYAALSAIAQAALEGRQGLYALIETRIDAIARQAAGAIAKAQYQLETVALDGDVYGDWMVVLDAPSEARMEAIHHQIAQAQLGPVFPALGPATAGRYRLKLGYYSDKGKAQLRLEALQAIGLSPRIEQREKGR